MVSPLFFASLFCSTAYAAPFRTGSCFWLCSSDSAPQLAEMHSCREDPVVQAQSQQQSRDIRKIVGC